MVNFKKYVLSIYLYCSVVNIQIYCSVASYFLGLLFARQEHLALHLVMVACLKLFSKFRT